MNKKLLLLIASFTLFTAHSQWYFETGFNDSRFKNFQVVGGNSTELSSFGSFRDISQSVGYLFSFKDLEKRFENNLKNPLFRLGVGIGFDQMRLKTNASFNGTTTVPVDYDLAQLQAKLGLHLSSTLIEKEDSDGFKRSLLSLLLSGYVGYNLYSHATQSTAERTIFLKDYDRFANQYTAYGFGAGLSFGLNKHTNLYMRYDIENSIGLDEENMAVNNNNNQTRINEDYSVTKHRISVGLLIDFSVRKRLKDMEMEHIEKLESKLKQPVISVEEVDLTPLQNRIAALEAALATHQHEQPEPTPIDERVYNTETHKNGFMYLPDFKHVLFPLNSSYFNINSYAEPLQNLIAFMLDNPQLKVKLIGYADSKTGTSSNNAILSERRAKRVYDYLVKKGADPRRLSYIGAGETLQFSIGNIDENRRTEIIILQH